MPNQGGVQQTPLDNGTSHSTLFIFVEKIIPTAGVKAWIMIHTCVGGTNSKQTNYLNSDILF